MIYDYSMPKKVGLPVLERIDRLSIPITECGCLIWLGSVNNDGYGRLDIDGKSAQAHRASYEATFGKIPEGKAALHKCDIPCCVNPDHIFIGTQLENIADRTIKRRGKNPVLLGAKNHNTKLTEEDVREIRAANCNQYVLAEHYGVSQGAISNIINRKKWTHI